MMKNKSLAAQLKSYLDACKLGDKETAAKSHPFLEKYLEESSWTALESDEKELLIESLLTWGESLVENHTTQYPLEQFVAAAALSPDPLILVREACAYLNRSDNISLWKMAANLIERVIQLMPAEAIVWNLAGQIFQRVGYREKDLALLEKAKSYTSHALTLLEPNSEKAIETFIELARIISLVGELSGEASDLWQAIEYFKLVEESGYANFDFFYGFAVTCRDLNALIPSAELQQLTIDKYQRAIEEDPTKIHVQISLATFAQDLYEEGNNEDHFLLAQQIFGNLIESGCDQALVWCKYALLIAIYGRRTEGTAGLFKSLPYFTKAAALAPDNAVILTRWAEVLVTCGVEKEDYELLRQGQRHMEKALALQSDNSEILAMYGYSLTELGNYFSDASYHEKAIESFKAAASVEPDNFRFIYGLALALLAMGMTKMELVPFQQAEQLLEQASLLNPLSRPEFFVEWAVALMRISELSLEKAPIEKAIAKFEEAIRLHAERLEYPSTGPSRVTPPDWLYHYGCCYDLLGDLCDEPAYYEKAIETFNLALEIEPEFANLHYSLALALVHLGELVGEAELFYHAFERFRYLTERDPEEGSVYEDWGDALIQLGLLVREPAAESISDSLSLEAENLLLRAIALGQTTSFYTIACLYSLRGDYESSIKYIAKAAQAKALPSLEELMHDEWLEGLRSRPAFRRMLFDLASIEDS
jgi:tetratricopeptide (TPR) repeat protein